MKRPSFQFYPSDWLRDTALRTCSVAARGLWIDMICYMHEGNPYGVLKVNQKVILAANLAAMIGATLQDTEGWLNELESAGVFDRGEDGEIMSRRMIRDENLRNARAIGGKLGGNPSLVKCKVNGKVNHQTNLATKNKVNQKPTPSSSSSTSVLVSTNVDTPLPFDSADFKFFWENWEQHLKEKKKPLKPTARKMQLAKLKEFGEQRAIAALKYSINGNCQGIYEGNESKQKPTYQHKGTQETIQVRNLMDVK